jgi:hypothetical protein
VPPSPQVGAEATVEKCVVVARMCVLSTTDVGSGVYAVDPCGAVKTIRSDSCLPAGRAPAAIGRVIEIGTANFVPSGPRLSGTPTHCTPAGAGAAGSVWTVIVTLEGSAPGGMTMLTPWGVVTVPPDEPTAWLVTALAVVASGPPSSSATAGELVLLQLARPPPMSAKVTDSTRATP